MLTRKEFVEARGEALDAIDRDNWSWFAGFMEGEGRIGVYSQTSRAKRESVRSQSAGYTLTLQVNNTDEKVMLFLKDTWGGSYCKTSPKRANERIQAKLTWSSVHASDILVRALPYMHGLKADEARLAIEFQDTKSVKYGHRGVPAKIDARRMEIVAELKALKQRKIQ